MSRAMTGTPMDLARWAHGALQSRENGKVFALVLRGKDGVDLIDAASRKFLDRKKLNPGSIVGYYTASRNMDRQGVTIGALAEDIEATMQ